MHRGIFAFLIMLGLALHAVPAHAAALTAKDDLLEACAGLVSQLRALNHEADSQADFWSTRFNTGNILNERLASDAEYNAAHPEGPYPADHINRLISDTNDCMIQRRLVQIAQGIPTPPQASAAPSRTVPPAAPQRQLALNTPPKTPKPEEDPDAPRKGDSGRPNPKQLYKNKPAVAENASRCIGLSTDLKLFGGFTNSCGFDVYVTWCAYHPVKGAWSDAFDCDKPGGGMGGLTGVPANNHESSHTHNAERIFWFACRDPSFPKVEYHTGQGFYGHCQ